MVVEEGSLLRRRRRPGAMQVDLEGRGGGEEGRKLSVVGRPEEEEGVT